MWNDANRDYVPQESELGPLSNRNFATAVPTTRVDDAIRETTPVFAPNVLRFCDVDVKWQTAVRFLGTVGLPWGIEAGATFQSNPGPEILANYTVTSAQVQGLGRALTTGTMTVPLVRPGTLFGDRISQLDLRLSKIMQFRAFRLRANLDLANALNSAAVLLQNNTVGTNWLRPSYVLPGRLIRPSVQIDF